MPELSTPKQVVVRGVRLTYFEREASTSPDPILGESPPPLLFLHGLIAMSSGFAALIAQLPQDRRIVALDLPGDVEDNTPEANDYSFAGLAALIRDFAATLGLHRPILVGHSHGGALALRFAASWRDEPMALILFCPAHPFSGHERWLIRFYNSLPGRAFARTIPLLPHWIHALSFRRVIGPKGRERGVSGTEYWKRLKHPGLVPKAMSMVRSWNADMQALGDDLTNRPLELPVFLLWGDRDGVVPLSTFAALSPHLRQREQVTLPGVGHLPPEEDTAGCAGLMRTFLVWLETNPKYAAWRSRLAELSEQRQR